MVAMYRQSLDRPATGQPPDIGPDARRLWRSGPAASQGHRLGAAPSAAAAGAAGAAGHAASALHEPLTLQDSEPVVDAA